MTPEAQMLNEGTQTAELDLAGWVLDPDAGDDEIVAAMRLPAGLSLETLIMDEVATVAGYHRYWSANAGLDTAELFLRNSACKRALYLSAPIFLPDTIPVARFVARHVNSRIHVYSAPDVMDTIRLEAVSSFEPNDFRFRYALSIQYAADSAGLGWQVIRPVIILDRRIMTAVHAGGAAARQRLERVLAVLRKIVLFGSHDYVHATVLNWFPPLRGLAPEYAAITCERVHPPEVEQWHEGTQAALPAGLVDGRVTPEIATLELYSLMVHGETIARLWEAQPRLSDHAAGLVSEFCAALGALADSSAPGGGLLGSAVLTEQAADYFTTLAFWFIVSALPIGSQRLEHLLGGAPERCRRACERLAQVHDGMFDFVRFADPAAFPWQGGFVGVHEVEAQYADALRWPAVRAYLEYLLRPRRSGGPGTWAQELCAVLPTAEAAAVLAALSELAASTSPQEYESALAALADGGQLGLLRGIAVGRPGEPGPARYARAILASFVGVTDALLGRRPRVPA